MFATPSTPIALNTPCPPVQYAITAVYKDSPAPWPLNACKHDKFPPPHSDKHKFLCECIWERIPPPPTSNPWSQKAIHYLSVIWFHSKLHKGYGQNWTAAHYHECLSLLVGHRFEQHQIFACLNHLRNDMPEEWINAAKWELDSPEVVTVFDQLNANWINFFSQFDLYSNMNLDELPEDFQRKPYHPRKQPAKTAKFSREMDKWALERGLTKPLRLERVEWKTEIGNEDVADSDDEAEEKEEEQDVQRLRDLERALKGLKFKRKGVPITTN
jgi:hypothetical protein